MAMINKFSKLTKEEQLKFLEEIKKEGFFESVIIINDKIRETMTYNELIRSINKHNSFDLTLREKEMDNGFKGELHYKIKK